MSHTADDPEPRKFWQLAYKTGVDGLFLRAEENGFFGPEWAIVTGSGWRLASGWWSREDADRAAAAVARVLPFIDWMSATADAFTAQSKKALSPDDPPLPLHRRPGGPARARAAHRRGRRDRLTSGSLHRPSPPVTCRRRPRAARAWVRRGPQGPTT